MDAFSRFVLSVIALCLIALLLGQVGLLPTPTSTPPRTASAAGPDVEEGEDGAPRFALTPIRVQQSFFLVRFDRITGQTWKVAFPSVQGGWSAILEEDEARAWREKRAAERAEKRAAEEAAEPR